MEIGKSALLYGPDGKEVSSSDYPKKDISSLDMQPYIDNTKFDIGDLVEMRFRDIDGNPRRTGSNTRLGYLIEDSECGSSIILAMCLPQKRWKQNRIAKNRISDFRVFPQTKDKYLLRYELLGQVMIGSIVELLETAKNPLSIVRYSGYISWISSSGIKISMDHPSNRYDYKPKAKKFDTYEIDKFRVLGHRKIW